jgi:thiol-disulfide isomerase/thioredoxin
MFKKILLIISLISLILFQGCSDEKNSNSDANNMVSKTQYTLNGLDKKQYIVKKDGNGFVLENAKGKIVILDIFATWCPPCRAVATHLTSLQKKYKDDLIIIGLTIEDDISDEELLEFRKEYTADYILTNSDQNRRLINAIAKELKMGNRYPIPLLAMYKDGELINYFVGATEEEFIESDIKKALGK